MMTRLPILTFHSIDESGSVISVASPVFDRMMRDLAREGWRGLPISAALAAMAEGSTDEKLFALSFDDGYRSVLKSALPTLENLGFSATVFVIAGRCGEDNQWPGQASHVPSMQLLDWTELENLAAVGWEIGSHGSSHLPLVAVSEPTARRETEEAKKSIERNLAIQVPLFAYPYGAHDESVRRIVADYHEAACGTRAAIASRSNLADRFDLPRIDAHYLRWLPVATTLGSPAGNAYLALRRWVAGFRHPHWDERSLGRTT